MGLVIVGAAWKKPSSNGAEYLSVSLDAEKLQEVELKNGKISLLIFEAREKKKETSPDMLVYRKDDK